MHTPPLTIITQRTVSAPAHVQSHAGLEEGVDEGLTEDQKSAKKKQKEADLLEAQRQRELAATQKINDGISLTQGEMKKHQEIDWNDNDRINQVTK